jgi:hypothetical protein
MRARYLVLLSGLGLFALGAAPAPATCDNVRDQAIVNFSEPVLVGTQWIMGRAVVVHDDDAKARGEACTFIYTQDKAGHMTLVKSYKCERVSKATSSAFKLVTQRDANNNRVLSEIQFAGQPFSHEFLRDNAPHVHGSN